jgi:protein required for attachment to host cells
MEVRVNNVWVVVCDAAKARFFDVADGEPAWRLTREMKHEASRSKAKDLVSDHSGRRSSEGASVHHNALAPGASPKEIEKEHFGHTLVGVLDHGQRSAQFGHWVLVAPPHFAGLIAKELTPQLKKHLLATVDKDLCHLDSKELAVKLRDSVRLAVDERKPVREMRKHEH